ncbi:MAG: TPM domain-containing protein [Oscillospiraceae bacterium]|jgi:uncharacterized protein|nr:TPM domain-containing protein [Oscillospiraceae bacterium]
MKRFVTVTLLILISIVATGGAYRQSPILPTVDFYVNDAAGIIFEEHRDRMMTVSADLEAKTGAQLVILTVSGITGGGSAPELAEAVFADWEIGGRQEQNGLLILVLSNPAGCVIHVGEGLSRAADAAYVTALEDEITASVRKGGSSRAVWDCWRELAPRLYQAGGATPDEKIAAILSDKGEDSFSPAPIIILAVVVFAVGRSARIARRNQKASKGPVRRRRSFIKAQRDENALPPSEELRSANADSELARYDEPEEIFIDDEAR